MIEGLLPETVAAEEIFGDDTRAYLLPEEQHLIASAVESRRRDVTHARTCARRALSRLGVAEVPILRGERGEPYWPEGVVGSITHTRDYCAAAVASSRRVRSVGIDAEFHDALPDGVLDYVAVPEERAWLKELGSGSTCWDRLLFSAKESIYKAWYPLTGRWLGFEDASVTVDPSSGTFQARLLVDGTTLDGAPLSTVSGAFLVSGGFVLTSVTVSPT